MTYEELHCRDVAELVTDYFEGALADDDQAILERHLVWCDWCGTYVEQMRETIRLTGALRDDEVPPPVLDALVAAYRDIIRR